MSQTTIRTPDSGAARNQKITARNYVIVENTTKEQSERLVHVFDYVFAAVVTVVGEGGYCTSCNLYTWPSWLNGAG